MAIIKGTCARVVSIAMTMLQSDICEARMWRHEAELLTEAEGINCRHAGQTNGCATDQEPSGTMRLLLPPLTPGGAVTRHQTHLALIIFV